MIFSMSNQLVLFPKRQNAQSDCECVRLFEAEKVGLNVNVAEIRSLFARGAESPRARIEPSVAIDGVDFDEFVLSAQEPESQKFSLHTSSSTYRSLMGPVVLSGYERCTASTSLSAGVNDHLRRRICGRGVAAENESLNKRHAPMN